jgi:membrane protease YdiL (CAAX protease family)
VSGIWGNEPASGARASDLGELPPWPTDGGSPPSLSPPTQPQVPVGPSQRAGRPEPGARGALPSRALWWALPGALAALVLSSLGAGIGEALTKSSKSGVTDLLGELGLWAGMFGTAVLVSHRYGTGSLQRDYGLGFRAKDILWAVAALVAALAMTGLVVNIFAGTRFSATNTQILTEQRGHEAGLVIVSLIVAVGAPFFEELFFRGYLRVALQQRFGAHGAVWLQAVLFGLAHFGEAPKMPGNVSVVLAMVGVGVVLGYTAWLAGRLGPGMLAHCLFNLLAVASVV